MMQKRTNAPTGDRAADTTPASTTDTMPCTAVAQLTASGRVMTAARRPATVNAVLVTPTAATDLSTSTNVALPTVAMTIRSMAAAESSSDYEVQALVQWRGGGFASDGSACAREHRSASVCSRDDESSRWTV